MLNKNMIKWRVRRVLLSLPRKLARPDSSVPNFQSATTSLCAISQLVQKPILKREHLTQLLKELNGIRDSKRRLITSSKKDKKTKPAEPAQVAG